MQLRLLICGMASIAAARASHVFSRGLIGGDSIRRPARALAGDDSCVEDNFDRALRLLGSDSNAVAETDLGLLLLGAGAAPSAVATKLAAAAHIEFAPLPQLQAPVIPVGSLWSASSNPDAAAAELRAKASSTREAVDRAVNSVPVRDARELLAAPSGLAGCGCTAVNLLGAKNHFSAGVNAPELEHNNFNLQESSDDDSDDEPGTSNGAGAGAGSGAAAAESGFADLAPQLLVRLPSSNEWVARALRLYPRALAVVGQVTRMWGPLRGCSVVVFDLLFSADRFRYWASVVQQCERRLVEAARRVVESPAAAALLGLPAATTPIVISSSGSSSSSSTGIAGSRGAAGSSSSGAGAGASGTAYEVGLEGASEFSAAVGKKRGRWDKKPLQALPAATDATNMLFTGAAAASASSDAPQIIEVRPNIQRAEAMLWQIMYANRLVRLAVGSIMGGFKFVADDKGEKSSKMRCVERWHCSLYPVLATQGRLCFESHMCRLDFPSATFSFSVASTCRGGFYSPGQTPPLPLARVACITGMCSDDLVVDLGSGEGAALLAFCLMTGCAGYGVELVEPRYQNSALISSVLCNVLQGQAPPPGALALTGDASSSSSSTGSSRNGVGAGAAASSSAVAGSVAAAAANPQDIADAKPAAVRAALLALENSPIDVAPPLSAVPGLFDDDDDAVMFGRGSSGVLLDGGIDVDGGRADDDGDAAAVGGAGAGAGAGAAAVAPSGRRGAAARSAAAAAAAAAAGRGLGHLVPLPTVDLGVHRMCEEMRATFWRGQREMERTRRQREQEAEEEEAKDEDKAQGKEKKGPSRKSGASGKCKASGSRGAAAAVRGGGARGRLATVDEAHEDSSSESSDNSVSSSDTNDDTKCGKARPAKQARLSRSATSDDDDGSGSDDEESREAGADAADASAGAGAGAGADDDAGRAPRGRPPGRRAEAASTVPFGDRAFPSWVSSQEANLLSAHPDALDFRKDPAHEFWTAAKLAAAQSATLTRPRVERLLTGAAPLCAQLLMEQGDMFSTLRLVGSCISKARIVYINNFE